MENSLTIAPARERRARRAWVSAATLRALVLPALLLALWQAVTALGLFERSQLPAPLDVLSAGWELATGQKLALHIGASLVRVLWGFAIGAGLAILLGLAVGLARAVEQFVAPTIQALRAIPSLAWVPLLILWMGIDEWPKITLVAIGVFFPVYTNLVSGIRQVDRKLVEAGHAYGLSGLNLAWQVLLPASLPSLLTGLRLGLAQGWLFLVAAELIAASSGLGFLLIDGQNTYRTDIIVMAIVLLAVIGKLTDWLLHLAERYVLRWTDTYGKA